MPTLDIFRSDAFSCRSLTASIETIPSRPTRIGAMGLFTNQPIITTTVQLEERNGVLTLIENSQRGAPASNVGNIKRKLRSFVCTHLTRESTIIADEVQNVRAFGSETEQEAVQSVVVQRLTRLKAEHDVTLEHLRAGAIKGQLLDSDGSTVIYDLYDEFDVAQQTAVLSPDSAADNFGAVRREVIQAKRLIEDELGGTVATGFRALCGRDFHDALKGDAGIVQGLRWADPMAALQSMSNTRVFPFEGVAWEEYGTRFNGTPFIADDEAYLFPEGVPDLFVTYFAPADFEETVNTLGRPLYAKQAMDPEFQRWVKLHTQSNPLPLCTRPRAVVKLTLST